MHRFARSTWLVALVATLAGCSGSVTAGPEGGGEAGTTSGGTGGSTGGSSTVGDLVTEPQAIQVTVNLADGFAEPQVDDVWAVDVAQRTVSLNGGAAVSLTQQQSDDLVHAVTSAVYHFNDSCVGMAIDGAPYPPELTVSAGDVSQQFGVSDATCAESDHSYTGNVIGCAAFGVIHAQLNAAAPSGHTFSCEGYW